MKILDDLKLQYRMGGVAQKLIYWNVGLFAVPYIVFGLLGLFGLHIDFLSYVSLSSDPLDLLWKPWSIVSYAFFHSGFFHILFNMLVLHFSSSLFTTYFTQKQLLNLYFVGGIFAGIIYIICYFIFPALQHLNVSLVGASGAIMAILFAAATFSPFTQVRLFLIGTVKLWHIALVLIAIDLIQLPLENTGGHLAHLAGAAFGYLYINQIRKGNDITGWFSKLIDGLVHLFRRKPSTPFKKVHKNYTPPITKTESKIVTKDKTQQQIDDILDKISRSGYDSLSTDEKEFLFKAGKN
ncbi:MAG TPA: rhomboid family intramembrane serine protease [Flavobacterium sp.]|jgi:membrane associated rhomboid family serine protease